MSTSNFSLPAALKSFLAEQADSVRFFILIAIFFLMPAGGMTLVAQEPSSALAASPTASPEPASRDAVNALDRLKELPNVVPAPIPTERIDRAGEEIGLTIGQIEHRASLVLGTWVTRESFRGITWFMVLVCLLLFLILLVFCRMIIPLFGLGSSLQAVIDQIFSLLFIAAVTWLILASLEGLEEFFLSRYRMDVADNLEARKIHTQVRFLKRLAITVVLVLAGRSMLMMFDKVRQFGTPFILFLTTILSYTGVLSRPARSLSDGGPKRCHTCSAPGRRALAGENFFLQ